MLSAERAGSGAGAGRQPRAPGWAEKQRKSGGKARGHRGGDGGSLAPAGSCHRGEGGDGTRPCPRWHRNSPVPGTAPGSGWAAGPGVPRAGHTSAPAASWDTPKAGTGTLGTPLWWPWRWRCHPRGLRPSRGVGWVWGFLHSSGALGGLLGLSPRWGHRRARRPSGVGDIPDTAPSFSPQLSGNVPKALQSLPEPPSSPQTPPARMNIQEYPAQTAAGAVSPGAGDVTPVSPSPQRRSRSSGSC